MKNIEVKILNTDAITQAEQMLVCAARLTQRGHKISNLNDFMDLYNKPYSKELVTTLVDLPHPTIQKFGVISIVVVGASRRFLAQITRHQNEVKYMSGSLQYSDYSDTNAFVVPYNIIDTDKEQIYLDRCQDDMRFYKSLVESGIDNDSAGYCTPQGLRNVLIISATPYQWKHMIQQRTCRRNTQETRYVLLKIWECLLQENLALFSDCGPTCMLDHCYEGKMSCKNPILSKCTPTEILKNDFSKLYL